MNRAKVTELQEKIQLEALEATLENVRQVRRKLNSTKSQQSDILDSNIYAIDSKAHLDLQKTITEAVKIIAHESSENEFAIENMPEINDL
jgi:hypothetical protein